MSQLHDYTLAVLGLPINLRARSLSSARKKLLRRYTSTLALSQGPKNRYLNYPIVPTLVLVSTSDPRQPAPR